MPEIVWRTAKQQRYSSLAVEHQRLNLITTVLYAHLRPSINDDLVIIQPARNQQRQVKYHIPDGSTASRLFIFLRRENPEWKICPREWRVSPNFWNVRHVWNSWSRTKISRGLVHETETPSCMRLSAMTSTWYGIRFLATCSFRGQDVVILPCRLPYDADLPPRVVVGTHGSRYSCSLSLAS